MRRDPWGWGPGEALHRSSGCLCLLTSIYCLTGTWEATGDLAISRAVGGSGSMNGAWDPSEATVGCCCLCSGQKVGGQMVQDSSWYVREALTQRWQGLTWLFRRWAAESVWCFPLLALLCVSLAHAQILDLQHKEQIRTVWYAPNISETSKKY